MTAHAIEQSALWPDIRDIMQSGTKPVRFEYRGMLHTEVADIPIIKITTVDIVRDYATSIGDHINIAFKLAQGDYMRQLYPYRTNMEFSIKRIQLAETGSGQQPGSTTYIERYKAVFIPGSNSNFTGSQLESIDHETLNRAGLIDVQLQLLSRSLETLRIKSVSGIYRQVTQLQVLTSLLVSESSKVLIDGKPAIDGVDIVTPDNQTTNQHVIIKDGVYVPNLPSYLQQEMSGVYAGGIGTYLQTYRNRRTWFVYPLYDVRRFSGNVGKAIFYAVPEERFPGLDHTYQEVGNILRVIVTGTRRYTDGADTDFMNHGSGFRMPNSKSFMKKPVTISPNGPVGSRARLNYEVTTHARADGLNFAPVSTANNPYIEYSKVLGRSLARIDLVWENANSESIYPGMPCKYVYLEQDAIVELHGTIVSVHAYTGLQGTGVGSSTYRTKCSITLLVTPAARAAVPITNTPPGVF